MAGGRTIRRTGTRALPRASQITKRGDRERSAPRIASEQKRRMTWKRDARLTRWSGKSSEPIRAGDRSITTPADQNQS